MSSLGEEEESPGVAVAPESRSGVSGGDEDVLVGPEATPSVSVVMPTLDEEDGVAECIRGARRALSALGVSGEILVSDSSSDLTPEIARKLGARVVEPDRPGYGYAYRYAFERVRGEYVVMGDADTTYDFEELPALLEPVRAGRADVVIGSRFDGEIRPGAMSALHRYVGNPLLTKFLNFFYDVGVTDAHSGFRVFRREVLEVLELESDGMEFASEMVMDAGAKGLTIEEVPITYHPREGEATLDSFQDGWRHVKFMLVNAPGYLFSVPGLVMGALGVALMTVVYLNVEVMGQPFGIHSLIAGSLLTILGYQVGSFGLLTDIASDPIRRPADPITHTIREQFSLERGVAIGAVLFAVGTVAAGVLIYRWVQSGFSELPVVSADILAFTMIVLGIQTVFMSFFGSIVAEVRD